MLLKRACGLRGDCMRTELLDRIKKLPLTFPYADFSSAKKIEPAAARLAAVHDELSLPMYNRYKSDYDACAEKYGLEPITPDHLPELAVARWQAAKYIISELDKRKIKRIYASEQSGISATLFPKYEKGERQFAPSSQELSRFCKNVLHESCHKVMFGEESRIILTKYYTELLHRLSLMPEYEIEKLSIIGRRFMEQQRDSFDEIELQKTRIQEYCYDRGIRWHEIFGDFRILSLNSRLYALFDDEVPAKLGIPTLMLMSFELNVALDYFVSADCLAYTDAYYVKDDELVLLEQGKLRQIIRYCYALQDEAKKKYLEQVTQAVLDFILY